MTRSFNILLFMAHYGLGVREGMALTVVSMYGAATARNISECMGVTMTTASSLINRLRSKEVIELHGMVSPALIKTRKGNYPEKTWKIKKPIREELDELETANKLPKWAKRRASPASTEKSCKPTRPSAKIPMELAQFGSTPLKQLTNSVLSKLPKSGAPKTGSKTRKPSTSSASRKEA